MPSGGGRAPVARRTVAVTTAPHGGQGKGTGVSESWRTPSSTSLGQADRGPQVRHAQAFGFAADTKTFGAVVIRASSGDITVDSSGDDTSRCTDAQSEKVAIVTTATEYYRPVI